MPPRPPEPAISAPGLIGSPTGLPSPVRGPREARRARSRPYRHAHYEIDLDGAKPRAGVRVPGLDAIESLLKERTVVEPDALVLLAAEALHALRALGFRRVDHWELRPGGWLPPPARDGAGDTEEETVQGLLEGLGGGPPGVAARARTFAVRLSADGDRVDLVVRRVHRQRTSAISVDLWGLWTKERLADVTGALARRLPVARSTLTRYEYA